jgi:DNA-binding beta-propeller fold protein YncE
VSEQSPDLVAGSQVAGYRLEERVGHGGMAAVFRAYDHRLDRMVALKILSPALASDDAFRRRFIRESRAAAAVDHPHIIPVFEAGEAGEILFIAMRLVRGGDVGSLVRRLGPLPADRTAEIISQTASALDAAHARGLVHRDVKPSNMLLDQSQEIDRPDHVYLSDFGLSKGSVAATGLTATGQFLGTLDYVAPEQIEGAPVDGRTDQYALACAAFELLTGAPPFRREDGVAVMYAHLHEPPPPLRRRRPELPAEIDAIMAAALAKIPAERHQSCSDFASALRRSLRLSQGPDSGPRAARSGTEIAMPLAEREQTAPMPTGQQPTDQAPHFEAGSGSGDRRRHRARRVLLPVLAAVVALAAAGGGYALASHGHAAGGPSVLTLPGCTTATATAPALRRVAFASSGTGGAPFGAAVSHDGRYAYVSTGNAIDVFRDTGGLAPALVRSIPAPGADRGITITHDGRYLVAADGSGAVVIRVAEAESGAGDPVAGSLTSPDGTGAVVVSISPDDQFAFVTLQSSAEMAVFRLAAGLASGFSRHDFVGYVHLGIQPAGMATGGRWIYVTSIGGSVSVISMATAERSPASAVVSTVHVACGPARAMLSADAKVLWVTVRESDALLAFSTVLLRTNPAHALMAKVMVGESPMGETFVQGGSRIVIADTNLYRLKSATANLAVIDTTKALAGHPALLGYVPTGLIPRQFAVEDGGSVLLVADQGSHRVQALRVADLP